METNSYSPAATEALATLREFVRDINPARLSDHQIELLNGMVDFALAHIQEARWLQQQREATLSQAVEYEVLIQAKIAAESDAADHQIAHLV